MTVQCSHSRALRRVRACALTTTLVIAAAALPCAVLAQAHSGAGAATHEAAEPHGMTTLQSVAKLANFVALAGILVYFLRSPVSAYLASRTTQIRQDLVTAAELRATATAQLAEIGRKLETLPAELDRLRAQGEEDLRAEQARLAQAAAAERDRLVEQTRREIATRLRVARRELTEEAARLAIGIAEQRIRQSITPDDQLRLVDRYTAQLREAR